MCLQSSMEEEDTIEHTNVNCQVFTHVVNLSTIV